MLSVPKGVSEGVSLEARSSDRHSSPLIARARRFAAFNHAGQVRIDGSPYSNHPAGVATILQSLGYDETTIAAGYCHDVKDKPCPVMGLDFLAYCFEVSGSSLDDVLTALGLDFQRTRNSKNSPRAKARSLLSQSPFPSDLVNYFLPSVLNENVALLVDGCTDVRGNAQDKTTLKDIVVFNALLHTAHDPRVFGIKGADRLENLGSFGVYDEEQKIRILNQTLTQYIPIIAPLDMRLHDLLVHRCRVLEEEFKVPVTEDREERVNDIVDRIIAYSERRSLPGIRAFFGAYVQGLSEDLFHHMKWTTGFLPNKDPSLDVSVTLNQCLHEVTVLVRQREMLEEYFWPRARISPPSRAVVKLRDRGRTLGEVSDAVSSFGSAYRGCYLWETRVGEVVPTITYTVTGYEQATSVIEEVKAVLSLEHPIISFVHPHGFLYIFDVIGGAYSPDRSQRRHRLGDPQPQAIDQPFFMVDCYTHS